MTKRPVKLIVDLNCPFPNWACSVSDGVGTAAGGLLRRFRSFADMGAWLAKNGYVAETVNV